MTRWLPMWMSTLALVAVCVGCGEQREPVADVPEGRPTDVPAATGIVSTRQPVVVSDDGSGAQLCFGYGSFGGPTECSDALVRDWSWAEHPDAFEESGGVRWGSFLLTGTFDGESFTPSEVRPGSTYEPEDPVPFEIPCPEPAGGWQVLDPSRTTNETLLEVGNVADRLPGSAMRAVSHTDGSPAPGSPEDTVVTVYVAEDPTGAEKQLREVWGGMLCVAEVEHSQAELTRIQRDLLDLPGLLEVGTGTPGNKVNLTVFHDDGRYQRWVDAEYGAGLVEVTSVLQPVD